MKRSVLTGGLFTALLTNGTAGADTVQDASLDWMSGCWVHEDGETREIWSEPEGGLMFGYSVTLRDGMPVFFEDLRIEPRPGGAVYVASPGGAVPTEFTESERGGLSIAFENPGHDYPQRIKYGLNRVHLIATISLLDGSQVKQFAMKRCESSERPESTDGKNP